MTRRLFGCRSSPRELDALGCSCHPEEYILIIWLTSNFASNRVSRTRRVKWTNVPFLRSWIFVEIRSERKNNEPSKGIRNHFSPLWLPFLRNNSSFVEEALFLSLSTSHSRRQSFHFTLFYASIRRSPFFISFEKWAWRHRTATQRTNVRPRWSFKETFSSTTFSEPIQRIVWYQRTLVSSIFTKHREARLCLLSVTSWLWSPMEFISLSVRVEHLFVCTLMRTSFYNVNVNFRGSDRLDTPIVIKSIQCYTFIVEEKRSLIAMCRSAKVNYSHRLQSFDHLCLWSSLDKEQCKSQSQPIVVHRIRFGENDLLETQKSVRLDCFFNGWTVIETVVHV